MNNSAPVLLCVDDEDMNLKLYEAILSSRFTLLYATGGQEALDILHSNSVDLIILDLMMPRIDGITTLQLIKSEEGLKSIPIIIATGLDDRTMKLKALDAGANDFLLKPIDHTELMVRVNNLLKIKEYHDFITGYNRALKSAVEEKTKELKYSYIETIHRLMIAAEYRDEDTFEHITRISLYSRVMAEYMGLSPECCEMIYYASPMHDVGKIGMPDGILNKPGHLTAEEFEIIKAHTLIGAKILKGSTSPILLKAEEIALTHHERWDGTGYPRGISGLSIPIESRILTIVDIYDALRMRRPYKPSFEHEKAVDIIINGDGRTKVEHFNPECLQAFKSLSDTFHDIFEGKFTAPWHTLDVSFSGNAGVAVQ